MPLLRICAFLLTISLAAAPGPLDPMEQRFAELRKSPPELYAFLLAMPKGGDLHNHLSGAVYAETYLHAAAEDGLCVDLKTYGLIARPCIDGSITAAEAESDPTLAGLVIDSLSMRNFVAGRESAHDHFFGTFAKFGPSRLERRAEFLAEVIRRAASQNESYLELIAVSGTAVNSVATRLGLHRDFETAKKKLLENGLADIVKQMSASLDQFDRAGRTALGCDKEPDSAACRAVVRYQYAVLRESPKEQVFAQILAGLMLASTNPHVAGINFVQPEDGPTSMRDYHLHMQMLDYLKPIYPNAHVALHAGELTPHQVPPEGLRFHVREAIELGHAERIGHGVDVMEETNSRELLQKMKERHTLVEINLTSNDLILGVRGADHPLPIYLKYGVPVALSTDDEGVSRTHLTEEFQRAVLTYGLSYAQVKQMVRNSLEYSFLAGPSYWQNHTYQLPAAGCAAGRRTGACQAFLKASEKARLQADLEDRFNAFERPRQTK